METETCRPFFGETQRKVVGLTGGSYADETCGALEPLWETLQDRWFGHGTPADATTDGGPRSAPTGREAADTASAETVLLMP